MQEKGKKGRKDRYTIFPEDRINMYKEYLKVEKPRIYLSEGDKEGCLYSVTSKKKGIYSYVGAFICQTFTGGGWCEICPEIIRA